MSIIYYWVRLFVHPARDNSFATEKLKQQGQWICLDIKYVWVTGEYKNYYLLTVLDVFTSVAVEQIFQKSVRKIDVINVFRRINNKFGIKGVTIRNDNGSQFIANDVKQFLRATEANQEFTHVATPAENSYIEAFHSIIQREVVDRYEFISFYDAKSTLVAHMGGIIIEEDIQ